MCWQRHQQGTLSASERTRMERGNLHGYDTSEFHLDLEKGQTGTYAARARRLRWIACSGDYLGGGGLGGGELNGAGLQGINRSKV